VHPQDTKCTLPARARVNFRTVFAGRVRFGGIFRLSLRATTKKRSSTVLTRKSAPQTKSWLRLCRYNRLKVYSTVIFGCDYTAGRCVLCCSLFITIIFMTMPAVRKTSVDFIVSNASRCGWAILANKRIVFNWWRLHVAIKSTII